MSPRSRLPPQRSDVDERPSTDAEQPSKPDLMCPTCGTLLVNVGNLNRHRRDLHRWVNPDKKRSRKAQPTQLALSERDASGPPLSISEPAGWMADSDLPIIPPFPPPEDVGDISQYSSDGQAPSYPQADNSSGYVDDVTGDSASYVQIEAPTPIRLPALTNSTLVCASSDPFTTPSPPCVAHAHGHTLGGNISSREDHSFATAFSWPVDDRNHSSDAIDSGGITDHGDFSIFEFGTTHSSVPSHRSTEFDVVKGSHYTPYQLQHARAPRHLNPPSIAGPDYRPQFSPTTHALPVQTMHFPPDPPPQPGLSRSDAMEVGCGQEQQAEAYRQQELALRPQVAFAQQGTARGPHHERNVDMVQGRQQQQESHSRIWPMRESHAPTQQYAGTSAPTHLLVRMDFDQRALQASTSYPPQAYHTPIFFPQSGDHLVCLFEQAPYQRSAHSAFESQLFSAFHSHRNQTPESAFKRYASLDEITHYLNDPAIHAPNCFGNFNPCCPESDTSAF